MATTYPAVKRGAYKPQSAKRGERLDVRVTPDEKAQLTHAAEVSRQPLSRLVVQGAMREAEQAIKAHEEMVLSARDSRAFVEALLNPSDPPQYLLDAIARYQAEFGAGPV